MVAVVIVCVVDCGCDVCFFDVYSVCFSLLAIVVAFAICCDCGFGCDNVCGCDLIVIPIIR